MPSPPFQHVVIGSHRRGLRTFFVKLPTLAGLVSSSVRTGGGCGLVPVYKTGALMSSSVRTGGG